MSPVAIGSDFAGYRLEELAGEGGMGRVYRATQSGLKRPVALKLIVPDLAHDESFRMRFKRESELAASIEHPNVIPVYEAGEAEGRLFIAMRWVQGTDLRTVIKNEGRLEPPRAVGIVGQIAAALDAAHRGGLVHRDVKPANVMLSTADGKEHVYLTDFGLTKKTTSDTPITKTGAFVGTPDYVPPEQIKGERADARADVYALGCVLFHTLSGRPPFERDTEVARMYAHLNDPPPRVTEVIPGTPAGLDEVIQRGLAKNPPDRYPSAGDLALAARGAMAGDEALPQERSLATGPAAPPATEVVPPKVLAPRAPARMPPRSAPPRPAPPAQPAPASSPPPTPPTGQIPPAAPAPSAAPAPPAAPAPSAAPARARTQEQTQPGFEHPWLLLLVGVLVAGVAGLIGRRLGQSITSGQGSLQHAAFTVLRRAEIWGVIGLALGAWLGLVRTRSREAMGVALTGLLIGGLAGALGGLVVAPADVVDSIKQNPGAKDVLQAVALAVEGGLIGSLIGTFWRPRSAALGLAAGAAGGVLAYLASDWEIKDSQSFESVAQVGVQAMVIAAFAITALILLGRRLSR